MSAENKKFQIIVKNLPFHTSWQKLKDLFNETCPVEHADIVKKGSSIVGIVTFSSEDKVEEAVITYDNFSWEGKEIRVYRAGEEEEDGPVQVNSTSLYVGNLPFTYGWQELKDLFRSTKGDVVHADVFKDYQGRSKGYGIVQMKSVEDAVRAIEDLNGFEIEGRKLEVREDRNSSKEGCQLHVGNLKYEERWQSLKEHFSQAGNVVHADVVLDNTGRSKGFGTVLMSTPEEATKAIEMFNETDFNGRTIQVKLDKFAGDSRNSSSNYRSGRGGYSNRGYSGGRKPYRGGRGGYSNGGNRSPQRGVDIIVGNIPFSTRWKELKDLVEKLDLNPAFADVAIEGSRAKGYGVVNFKTEEEAEEAIKKLNDYEYEGRKLFARMKN
jgi:RNA recognition motif-containing protein